MISELLEALQCEGEQPKPRLHARMYTHVVLCGCCLVMLAYAGRAVSRNRTFACIVSRAAPHPTLFSQW